MVYSFGLPLGFVPELYTFLPLQLHKKAKNSPLFYKKGQAFA